MKIVCKKNELARGMQTVQNAVSSKSTLPILSHILLEAEKENKLKLCATDLEVGIRTFVNTEIIESGAVTLPGRMISDIVKEAPEDMVEILTEEKSKVVVNSGKSCYRIMGLPGDEFPKLPELVSEKSFNITCEMMKEIIKRNLFAISRDEARYALNGILIRLEKGEIIAVATDGRRLSILRKDVPGVEKMDRALILPSKAVNEINKIIENVDGEVKISIGENEVVFHAGEVMIAARLLKGDFPDYDKVIPKTYNTRLTLERERFLSCMKRVSLVASEKSNIVRLSLGNGKMILSASTPELGEATEDMDVSYDGEDEILAFNPSYIMDFLRNETCGEVYVDIINSESPIVLRAVGDESYLYVTMPIKI